MKQILCVSGDRLQRSALRPLELPVRFIEQQIGISDDAVERRSQFVRDIRDEMGLQPARFLRLLGLSLQQLFRPLPLADVGEAHHTTDLPAAGPEESSGADQKVEGLPVLPY